jgi:hypothetical protein
MRLQQHLLKRQKIVLVLKEAQAAVGSIQNVIHQAAGCVAGHSGHTLMLSDGPTPAKDSRHSFIAGLAGRKINVLTRNKCTYSLFSSLFSNAKRKTADDAMSFPTNGGRDGDVN